MNDDQKRLLYLFERPYERLNIPRGRGSIVFQPDDLEVEELATRWGTRVTTMRIPTIPNVMKDMHMVKLVKRGTTYSQFNPLHRAAAKELIQRFMDPQIKNMQILSHVAASIKDRVNEELFIYALSYAIIRNPKFDSRLVPAIYEVFPNKFIPQHTIKQAMDQLRSTQYKDPQNLPDEFVVEHNIEFTGSDLNPEHRVAYFREDYGLNAHHWHWHLVFPVEDERPRDRKGEIFFYMHNQMMARYDWERLSNWLNRVVKLNNWREPIPEGYFPKLTINNSAKQYGTRPDNMMLQDFTRIDKVDEPLPFAPFDINDMERWRTRLFDAIHKGYMKKKNGDRVILSDNVVPGPDQKRGVDILGDTFEADADLSVNPDFYGSLHSAGHDIIGFIHDPQGHHKEEVGVIGDTSTSCRDPAFWRWHKFVDDVFNEYKMLQEPYKDNELILESVEVESVTVTSGILDDNVLETGWNKRTIEASRGLDFRSEGRSIKVNLEHLTHRPFTYNIQVTNNQTDPCDVTVRVYMAPKRNEANNTMTFMDQRLLWAEMDKFKITLEPGSNSLERLSTESSITIPDELTFRDLEENPPSEDDPPSLFCGCGWPQHLLLPMGRVGGMDFQIFVLISDWELDKVEGSAGEKACSNAASYCGILNAKFPDARPMGYPFDRKPNTKVNELVIRNFSDFADALPNAIMSDIKIYLRNEILNLD
ncbi:unnamed protein product, partial [Meganyctiphanes norvegica]